MSDLNDTLAEALEGRHTSTRSVAQWFIVEDRADWATVLRQGVQELAVAVLLSTPDGPELTIGLRKLLEAQDAILRAGAV